MWPAGPILPSLVKVTEEPYMFAFDDGEQHVSADIRVSHVLQRKQRLQ